MMGLGFVTRGIPSEEDLDYNEKASWSYSGFNMFRDRLVRTLGLARGIKDLWQNPLPYTNHPLYPLLMHSDCDGELSPAECARIVPVLKAAVAGWPSGDYDRVQALRLAEHMSLCVEMNRELGFC